MVLPSTGHGGVPSQGGEMGPSPGPPLIRALRAPVEAPFLRGAVCVVFIACSQFLHIPVFPLPSIRTSSLPWAQPPPPAVTWACSHFAHEDFDVDCYAQRRLSGGSHSYSGESPHLSPCSSIGKLSKSDEQLSSLDRDSGQCSRNTSCETLGEPWACESPPPALHFPVAPVRSDGEASHWLC